ncbi:cation acetate symporter, partial [Chromobacterium piscinae]|nr:cation acetate symporter [Chromobacterium piscinae]
MSASQLLFLALTLLTLGLTAAARRRTASLNDFYTAGGRLPAWQNGLALAGDYLSAAAFLGAAGMYLGQGYDSLAYAVGTLAGWPLLLLLLAGPLRKRGRYTVAGVLSQRFDHAGVRLV